MVIQFDQLVVEAMIDNYNYCIEEINCYNLGNTSAYFKSLSSTRTSHRDNIEKNDREYFHKITDLRLFGSFTEIITDTSEHEQE